MKGRAWTTDEMNTLKKLRNNGAPAQAIAQVLGRDISSVQAKIKWLILTDDTFNPPRLRRCWTIAERKKMQDMYDDGYSAAYIAAKFGTSAAVVYNYVTPRKRKK